MFYMSYNDPLNLGEIMLKIALGFVVVLLIAIAFALLTNVFTTHSSVVLFDAFRAGAAANSNR